MSESTSAVPEPREGFGIFLRLCSGLCFTAMTGLIKVLADAIPLGQVVFFRSAVAMIPLVIYLWLQGDFPGGLHTQKPLSHIIRCGLGILAMFCSFAAIQLIPIAEITTIQYLSPVFIVILARWLLQEAVNPRRWLGVALGLAGVLLFTLPNFSGEMSERSLLGIGLGLLSALLIAGALLQVRRLSQMGENPGAIAFYFALTGTVVGGVLALFQWGAPTPMQWLLLIGIGLLGGIAQILMTLSFRYAEASAMAPYEYVSILWAVLMGMCFFSEIPDMIFLLSAPLIVAGAFVARPRNSRYRTIR